MRKSRRKRRDRRRKRTRRQRGRGKKGKKEKNTFKVEVPDWAYQPDNNFNNIGLVESEGEFPDTSSADTTSGELSVEKTIEEQGLEDMVLGGTSINSDENTNMSNEERDDYYFAPNVEALGDEALAAVRAAMPSVGRSVADMEEDPEIAAAAAAEEDRRTAEMKRRQFQKELLDLGVDPHKKFVGLETDRDPHLRGRRSPWMSAAMLRDPQTRLTLEREKHSAVSPFLTSGLGAGSVSPPPGSRAYGNQKNEEEKEEEFKEAWKAQRRREMEFRYDKEDLEKAEKAAAAAAKDPKVGAAANAAADEWDDVFDDKEFLFDYEQGGGRRKRRRRRRRTRKKKAGYGPITTGGWIPHNLLLPSQHLGSLSMWWV